MGFGKLLEQKMQEKKIKQAELAAAVGIPKTTLNSIILRDNTKIEIETFLKMCDYLGCDPDEFYNDFREEKTEHIKHVSNDDITSHEREIIRAYREQSESVKTAICKMLDVEYSISETIKSSKHTEKKPQVTKIYRAARSVDNHPAEIVETTKDFSKIPPTDIKF